MTDSPRYTCQTKATDRESGEPRYSHNWVVSRRARLRIYEDRIECGNWRIVADDVQAATIYRARQWLIIPVDILVVQAGSRVYQFGLNPWNKVRDHLPVDFDEEPLTLKYSPFSIALRLGLLGYFVYWLFGRV